MTLFRCTMHHATPANTAHPHYPLATGMILSRIDDKFVIMQCRFRHTNPETAFVLKDLKLGGIISICHQQNDSMTTFNMFELEPIDPVKSKKGFGVSRYVYNPDAAFEVTYHFEKSGEALALSWLSMVIPLDQYKENLRNFQKYYGISLEDEASKDRTILKDE